MESIMSINTFQKYKGCDDLPLEASFTSCFRAVESKVRVAWALLKTKDCSAFSLASVSRWVVELAKAMPKRQAVIATDIS